MAGRLSFEEVLDEALAAQRDTDGAGGARYWTGPPPTFFLPFCAPRSAPRTSARMLAHRLVAIDSRVSAFAKATADKPNADCRMPGARPVLTAHQQEALDHLLSLGARLRADFTARDLRSAFRDLARRYHPDRHHGGSLAEIAHVTRVFATMSAHYQCLLAAVD